MEHWEDIFKDKLENLERPLPEGDLSEFREKLATSRLEGKRNGAGVYKVFAFAFVAAVLALFLLLPDRVPDDKHEEKVEIVSVVDNDNSEPAVGIDVARPAKFPDRSSKLASNAPETIIVTDRYEEEETRETAVDPETEEKGSVAEGKSVEENRSPFRTSSPVNFNVRESFRPINMDKKRKATIVSAAVGGVSASTLISLLVGSSNSQSVSVGSDSPGLFSGIIREYLKKYSPGEGSHTDSNWVSIDIGTESDNELGDDTGGESHNEDRSGTGADTGNGEITKAGPSSPQLIQEPSRYNRNSMPITVSLSVRYPISDKLSLNSGVDYSIYKSTVYCGESVWGQSVHYLGVPLRLDYSFVDTRFLNCYVGAGPELDWCLKAIIDGKTTDRDGLGISLKAAAGMQFNINASLGLFVEPGLGCFLRTDRQVLDTWRTEHPVSFNVSFGLRYTIK